MVEATIVAYDAEAQKGDLSERICTYQESLECPVCHSGWAPTVLKAYYIKNVDPGDSEYDLGLLEFCRRCRRFFLESFHGTESFHANRRIDFGEAYSSVPLTIKNEDLPKEIAELSPDFVAIYTQASVAESQGLDHICGVGYRKALEYLVKDYLCDTSPDDAEAIKTESLGTAIQRIEDPDIRILAERSAWIGNDETHYVRKHTDVDIETMKCFIRAMCAYIKSEPALKAAKAMLRK